MSRLAFRAAAAVVGVALLLAVYLAAAAFVADAALSLGHTPRPPRSPRAARRRRGRLGRTSATGSGPAQVLASLEGDRLPRERAPDLHHRIDALAARMAVDRPALYVTDARAPNAFAVGGGSGGGALVMDRSLFRILSAREVEAIVAHELAHLETNDGLALAMADGIGRAVVGFTTVLALPALLALSGLAAASSAWIGGRPGDRSGPFAWLHRARSRTDCSPASYSRLSSPGRGRASGSLRPTTVRLR